MAELTKEEIKGALKEAMAEAVEDAMSKVLKDKIERTFGIDCSDVDERAETRKDMEFLRALRMGARHGGEKIFWWVMGIAGISALTLFWPDFSKYFKG